MFTYVIPLSREAGFELPEDLEEEIMRLTRAYKENLIQKPDTISPNELYYLYESVEEKDQVLTRDEVAEYLHESYDYVTGGYNSMVFVPQSDNSVPQAESRPELYQTCVAIKLLDAANLKITDRDKTYEFVMQCKHKYGFMRTPDAFDSNLLTIYAGVTILKYL
jgi:prenyltransferase beta subunit